MRAALACLALATALLAGCTADPEVPIHQGPLPERSLDAPPELVVGEWWTYNVTSDLLGAGPVEATVVMAGSTNETWKLGMPSDAFDDFVLLSHFPFVGELNRTNFTFPVHNEPIQFLSFPLVEGATWETTFSGVAVTARVAGTSQDRFAHVEILGGMFDFNLTYDAQAGAFSRLHLPGYGLVELVGHGSGFTGEVRVPVNQQLAIFSGRALGVVDIGANPLVPAPMPLDPKPAELLPVEARQEGSLLLFAGNAFVDPATPGVFSVQAVAPDMTRHDVLRTPQDGMGVSFTTAHVTAPGGEWRVAYSAAGGGIAAIELMVYDVEAVDLVA